MYSTDLHNQQPPRRSPHHHRRARPELDINTFGANDAGAALDPDLPVPLSPPLPVAALPSPAIPTKSSQRSLKTFPGPYPQPHDSVPANTTTTSSKRSHPPVSAKGKQQAATARQAAAPNHHNRNAARDKERSRDRVSDWAKDAPVDSFLDTMSTFDSDNKENNFPSDTFPDPRTGRRESSTPPPHGARVRDSHDLSLSPRNVTRDSLLGNMLLSLDQFSMGQMTGIQGEGVTRAMSGFADPSSYRYYEEEEDGTRTMTGSARPPRPPVGGNRGGGHGYSYSSDYDGADDSSHMSSGFSRGRRSTSSSAGYQPNLGRINSMREPSANQRASPNASSGSRPLHSRGGRGSKSSSTNSIDPGYAQVLGSQRWAAHGLGGSSGPKRSSSFEIARRQSFGTSSQSADHQQQRPPWHIEFSNSFFASANTNHTTTASSSIASPFDYDVDDAAPTPTVPAGPRRLATMPSMPSFPRPEPMGEPLSPVRSVNLNLERRRSTKSSRSNTTATTRHSHHSMRFNNGRDNASPIPPLPGPVPDLDSAPAPHVGYEKAKEPVHAPTPASAVSQPPKEKPGFFRRMFGGSKNSVVAALDQSATSPSLTHSALASPATTATSITMGNASMHSPFATPSNSNSPSRQTSSSHALQKKPSGFFRRRKKSISVNNVDPPPLPTTLPPPILPPADLPLEPPPKRLDLLTPRAQPSPVTSLRKAMDPYLTSPGASSGIISPAYLNNVLPSGRHFSAEEINHPPEQIVRGFSPDYEPDPKATIRSVSSESRLKNDSRKYFASDPYARRPSTPTKETSKLPYAYERAASFLHDDSDSDSEGSPPRVMTSASQPAMGGSHSRSMSPSATTTTTLLAPIQTDLPLSSPSSNTTIKDKKLDRLTQDSLGSDSIDRPSSLTLPIEGARTNSAMLKSHASATSIPSLKIEESEPNSKATTPKAEIGPLDEPEFVVGDPTEDDRAKAQKMFDGNEDFIPKEKAASWMGEEGPIRQRTLRAYMDLYDFANKSVVTSLRDVCNRLILRAETQQVDRVLVAFSRRWCECNSNHGFKSIGMCFFARS